MTGDSPWSSSCTQSRQALKTQAYRDWGQPLVTQLSPVTANGDTGDMGIRGDRGYGDKGIPGIRGYRDTGDTGISIIMF